MQPDLKKNERKKARLLLSQSKYSTQYNYVLTIQHRYLAAAQAVALSRQQFYNTAWSVKSVQKIIYKSRICKLFVGCCCMRFYYLGLVYCFHPILVTWFLVVFGDEVMKILRNSLFIFHYILAVLPCKRKTSYRKSRN